MTGRLRLTLDELKSPAEQAETRLTNDAPAMGFENCFRVRTCYVVDLRYLILLQ